MKIKNAVDATEQARRILGNPVRFLPVMCQQTKQAWRIKAIIGILDDIRVELKLPKELLDV